MFRNIEFDSLNQQPLTFHIIENQQCPWNEHIQYTTEFNLAKNITYSKYWNILFPVCCVNSDFDVRDYYSLK